MNKFFKVLVGSILGCGLIGLIAYLLQTGSIAVLDPRGLIASEQYQLMLLTTLLMLVIVVPVFVMTFVIAWKYRASNTTATYSPDWDHSRLAETLWWAIPCVIIGILAIIIWKSSHDLDPFKPLVSDKNQPITIQVVALQWKWLFIYPEQQIASVNEVRFPADTPVNFNITADAPMNSFWIPQLGGQVYAMAGMETQLHLIADNPGTFAGSSANLSGAGFADMRFEAKATSQTDFDRWVKAVKENDPNKFLNKQAYAKLAKPGKAEIPTSYASVADDIYRSAIMKYMAPQTETNPHQMHPESL